MVSVSTSNCHMYYGHSRWRSWWKSSKLLSRQQLLSQASLVPPPQLPPPPLSTLRSCFRPPPPTPRASPVAGVAPPAPQEVPKTVPPPPRSPPSPPLTVLRPDADARADSDARVQRIVHAIKVDGTRKAFSKHWRDIAELQERLGLPYLLAKTLTVAIAVIVFPRTTSLLGNTLGLHRRRSPDSEWIQLVASGWNVNVI